MAQQTFSPAGPSQSERFEESRAEFGRHDVVQNRIDGRIEVEHDTTEIQSVIVSFNTHRLHLLVGRQDDPQRENAERQQTNEEESHYGAQHGNHLAACSQVWVDAVAPGRYRRRCLHLQSTESNGECALVRILFFFSL